MKQTITPSKMTSVTVSAIVWLNKRICFQNKLERDQMMMCPVYDTVLRVKSRTPSAMTQLGCDQSKPIGPTLGMKTYGVRWKVFFVQRSLHVVSDDAYFSTVYFLPGCCLRKTLGFFQVLVAKKTDFGFVRLGDLTRAQLLS